MGGRYHTRVRRYAEGLTFRKTANLDVGRWRDGVSRITEGPQAFSIYLSYVARAAAVSGDGDEPTQFQQVGRTVMDPKRLPRTQTENTPRSQLGLRKTLIYTDFCLCGWRAGSLPLIPTRYSLEKP